MAIAARPRLQSPIPRNGLAGMRLIHLYDLASTFVHGVWHLPVPVYPTEHAAVGVSRKLKEVVVCKMRYQQ